MIRIKLILFLFCSPARLLNAKIKDRDDVVFRGRIQYFVFHPLGIKCDLISLVLVLSISFIW